MMFNKESPPYTEAFLEEVIEQLQGLENKLVFLENNPSDHTRLDDIFRITYNLKCNMATADFEKIATLAYYMEDFLDSMRKGRVHPSGEIIDTLLTYLDTLKELVSRSAERVKAPLKWKA